LTRYNFGRDIHLFYHILKRGKGFYFTEIFGTYNIHEGGVFSQQRKSVQNFINHYFIYKELYLVNRDEYTRYMYLKQNLRLLNLKISGYLKNEEFKFISMFFKSCSLLKNYREALWLVKAFVPVQLKR